MRLELIAASLILYRTYDANKSFKRMVEAGLLDSVKEL